MLITHSQPELGKCPTISKWIEINAIPIPTLKMYEYMKVKKKKMPCVVPFPYHFHTISIPGPVIPIVSVPCVTKARSASMTRHLSFRQRKILSILTLFLVMATIVAVFIVNITIIVVVVVFISIVINIIVISIFEYCCFNIIIV